MTIPRYESYQIMMTRDNFPLGEPTATGEYVLYADHVSAVDGAFKDFIRRMMRGWMIREASYVLGEGLSMGHYTKDAHVAMLEAFEGDKMRADFAGLFGYWANDTQSLAAEHLHLAIKHGEVVAIDPPPQDGQKYWYDLETNTWVAVVEAEAVAKAIEAGGEEDCTA